MMLDVRDVLLVTAKFDCVGRVIQIGQFVGDSDLDSMMHLDSNSR